MKAPLSFPLTDAIRRAKEIKRTALAHGASGVYSHSKRALAFRQDVAAIIQNRDGGVPCNPNHIFLTNGGFSPGNCVDSQYHFGQ